MFVFRRRMEWRSGILRGDAEFPEYWIGQTFSVFGSHVSGFAQVLPATHYPEAEPREPGWLQAMSGIPFLLFSLLVGVMADRVRRLRQGDAGPAARADRRRLEAVPRRIGAGRRDDRRLSRGRVRPENDAFHRGRGDLTLMAAWMPEARLHRPSDDSLESGYAITA